MIKAAIASIVAMNLSLHYPETLRHEARWMPKQAITFKCRSNHTQFNCKFSRLPNAPGYDSFCFYVSAGASYNMRTDYHFGFFNEEFELKVNYYSTPITAEMKDLRSGKKDYCVGSNSTLAD